MKDDFDCHSHFDSEEGEELEGERRLWLLSYIDFVEGVGESKTTLVVNLILILRKGRSGTVKDDFDVILT
jgi:hypothetical protein